MDLQIKETYRLKNWLIVSFVVFNITDMLTTLLAGWKHGFEYEMNIIYVLTNSIIVFFLIKIVFVYIIFKYLTKWYSRLKYPLVSYFFIYVTTVLTVLLFLVSMSNYSIYKISTDDIGIAYTDTQKIEIGLKQINNLENMNPQAATGNDAGLILFNIFQFLVWRSFEKWKN